MKSIWNALGKCAAICKNLFLYLSESILYKYSLNSNKIEYILSLIITYNCYIYSEYYNLIKLEEFLENQKSFEKIENFINQHCIIYDEEELEDDPRYEEKFSFFHECWLKNGEFNLEGARIITQYALESRSKYWIFTAPRYKWPVSDYEVFKIEKLKLNPESVEYIHKEYKSPFSDSILSDDTEIPTTTEFNKNRKGYNHENVILVKNQKKNILKEVVVISGLYTLFIVIKLIN